ncbi:hypothetical protein ACHQM5_013187 [Ranunculus cassubicifolius]
MACARVFLVILIFLMMILKCRGIILSPQCQKECMPVCYRKHAPVEACERACAAACAQMNKPPPKGPLADVSLKQVLDKIFP